MVSILQEMAKGYVRTTQRRDYYTNKKGEEKFRKSEVNHFYLNCYLSSRYIKS